MTTAATSLLGLALPVTGELSGTWGDTVNNSITSLLDTAVAGTTTLSTDGDVTLSTTTLAANQARQAILLCSGARTAIRTITAPAQSKIYTIINATTGGFAVKLVGVGPTTGLTIPNGASAVVAWNGSDFIEIGSSTIGNLTVNGNLTVTGTTTLSGGTANGVAYLNGSKVVTTGSALTFDGSKLGVGTTPAATIHGYVADGGYVLGLSGTTKGLRVSTDSAQTLIQGVDNTLIGSYQPLTLGGSILVFQANGTTEAMRLTSTGLGIGTSSPAYKLDVNGSARIQTSSGYNFYFQTSGTTARINYLNDAFSANISAAYRAADFAWQKGDGSEVLKLDSSGNLGIGTTSPQKKLVVSNGGAVGMEWSPTDYTGNMRQLVYNRSTSAYVALRTEASQHEWYIGGSESMRLDSSGNLGLGVTPSTWSNGKAVEVGTLGSALWGFGSTYLTNNAYYNGGWKYASTAAASYYQQSAGVHYWLNAPSGTAGNPITFTQAMTLDASGNLLVGTTSARDTGGTRSIAINGVGLAASLDLTCTSSGGRSYAIYTSGSSNNGIQFYDLTASAERARIDSSGNLLVGCTATPSASVKGGAFVVDSTASHLYLASNTTASDRLAWFYNPNGLVGGIVTSASATAYNTSSDYRLKDNPQPMTGALSVVQQLKPCTYTWKVDGSQGQGFIAHELQEVVPDCVTGEKDAVDADGNPVYQGIDTSFLVATLTAAIQEQQALITQLQADVAALKGN